MGFENTIQQVTGGANFDGTSGKGRFFEGGGEDRTGTKIVRMALKKPTDAIDIQIVIVSSDGEEADVYNEAGVTEQSVLILAVVPLVASEHLEIRTAGSPSDLMRMTVTTEDMK